MNFIRKFKRILNESQGIGIFSRAAHPALNSGSAQPLRCYTGPMAAAGTHRILLVDDEPSILEAIGLYLQGPGVEILNASELEEAEALIERKNIDLVIADLKLTGVFGLECFQLLTFVRETAPQSAVILLTAFGTPEIEAEAYRRGARYFFHKPVPMDTLAAAVRMIGVPVAP
jgi:DNA-binding NtrC family response regulator